MSLFLKTKQRIEDKFKLFNKTGAGFTIIELVVVVSIIGILATIVTTNAMIYTKKARTAAETAALRRAIIVSNKYYEQYSNYDNFCSSSEVMAILNDMGGAGALFTTCDDTTTSTACQNGQWNVAFQDRGVAMCIDNQNQIYNDSYNTSYWRDGDTGCCCSTTYSAHGNNCP